MQILLAFFSKKIKIMIFSPLNRELNMFLNLLKGQKFTFANLWEILNEWNQLKGFPQFNLYISFAWNIFQNEET